MNAQLLPPHGIVLPGYGSAVKVIWASRLIIWVVRSAWQITVVTVGWKFTDRYRATVQSKDISPAAFR